MDAHKDLKCPVHNVALKKKRIQYGLIEPGMKAWDDKNVILGGCCINPDIKYGYECPVDKIVYYLDLNGNLESEEGI